MKPAPLAVGTTLWSWRDIGSAQSLCRQAEQAQRMGFDSIWLPENHFSGPGAIPSPLTVLAAMAARTDRIRLGCTSYLLPIRHPLQAAEEVAVLDQLCEGRLILGLGRGIQEPMFEAFGVKTADKRERFAAHLAVMRSAWRGEPVLDAPGSEPVRLAPLPVQQPEPALWVAAFGPLALEQVAGLGLPYLASPLESLTTLLANYRHYHAAVATAGHPPVTTIPVMRTVHVCASAAQAAALRDALADTVPQRMRAKSGEVDDWAIVGEAGEVAERISHYREALGMTHLVVRAGIRGVDESAQLESHEQLLRICADL